MAGRPFYQVGDVKGRLTIVQRLESSHDGRSNWLCRCECGTEFQVAGKALTQTGARPCICSRRVEVARRKAGQSKRKAGAKTRTDGKASKSDAERGRPEKPFAGPDTPPVIRPTAKTLEMYNALPIKLREAVDADVEARLRTLRAYKISAGNLNTLYDEAIAIARIDAENPPPVAERERYEPYRAYTQYQSGKGA